MKTIAEYKKYHQRSRFSQNVIEHQAHSLNVRTVNSFKIEIFKYFVLWEYHDAADKSSGLCVNAGFK